MRRLIVRPGAIGDCILALPAMEALRAEFTEVWVASQNVPLVRWADCVRSIASAGLDMVGLPGREPPAAALNRLAAFDDIVSWYGANREEFRAAVAGLPFRFFPVMPEGDVHAADFYLRQVTGRRHRAVPRLACPRWDGGFTVIHPFSGSPRKNWPLARFRAVAEALPGEVKWCAGPEEPLEDAVRFDDLYELACWLAGARLFLGNDSGIGHLAAAVGTPVVVLFGPSDARVWAPRGRNVTVLARARLEDITVEEVCRAVSARSPAGSAPRSGPPPAP